MGAAADSGALRGVRRLGAPFSRSLLAWYGASARDLPWRRNPGPYRTLVSEFMLQQTGVAVVVPYFRRFVRRFPDLARLAAAREEDVLALWSGLGYYARARRLHQAARVVVLHHQGQLPRDSAALRDLPGVGAYTAAAVAAIAFGAREFALDGNGARVLARLTATTAPIDEPAIRVRLRAAGQALVPPNRPGDFVQAVMELGARVCLPRSPRCDLCPVAAWCRARALGRTDEIPARRPKTPRRLLSLICVAATRGDRVLLVRQPPGGLFGGTWTLPVVESGRGQGASFAVRQALAAAGASVPPGAPRPLGAFRHVLTHRDLDVRVVAWAARASTSRGQMPSRAAIWAGPRDFARLALPTFTRRALALLGM